MIYLDNAATTAVDDDILINVLPYLTSIYYNPSLLYNTKIKSEFHWEVKMDKLVKIGRFQAESPELAKEVAETLINAGFIISIDDEFDCTVVVYKKIKTQ